MSVYRLIATDLDGTLLGRGHVLTPRTRAALLSLIERGYNLVVATGRPFDIVRLLCAGVTLTAPQITFNGAVIYDPLADRVLSQALVPPAHVPGVLDFLFEADVPAVAYAVDSVYLDCRIENPEAWAPPPLGPGQILEDMRGTPREGIIKIAGESDEATIRGLRPLAEAHFGECLYVTQTSRTMLEFLNRTASKGAALRRIAESLGIPRSEIIAFGDSHNDLTMFEAAGLSVAVGNSSGEVRAAADRVTLTNGADGVAVVLEELGLVEPYLHAGVCPGTPGE